jgi:exonuclease 3'-5' domain-containing protein 2
MKTSLQATTRVIYHNIKVFSIDGELLFTASLKRANWYLDRGLATVLKNDPLEIQLTFRHKGDGNKDDPFFLQVREDKCCVCGNQEQGTLTLHHCVPISYRSYFPIEYRNHNHFDVLPLCVPCHERYNPEEWLFRLQLSREYDVPIHGIYDEKLTSSEYVKVRKSAYALVHYAETIPAARKEFLLNQIIRITKEDNPDLQKLASAEYPKALKTQGQLIVEKLTDIDAFILRWRKHFVETMKPMHLPDHYDINRKGIKQ